MSSVAAFKVAIRIKNNVDDIIMIENQKKRKYKNQINFLHKSPSNRWFRNEIHSLLSWADARGSADIIYSM